MPAALEVNWDEVKLFCVSGHSYKDASSKYDIDEATIRQRSHREQWPMPERVSQLVTRVAENQQLAQKMAETWAEKGEEHRSLAFKVAKKAMEGVSMAPPEVKDWSDVERIDKMARRAAGLDTSEAQVSATFNFAMLGQEVPAADIVEVEPEKQDLPE